MIDAVSTKEIAEMLGVTRRRAGELTRTVAFPAPVSTVHRSKWWNRVEIEAWARRTGRPVVVGPRPPEPPSEADLDEWTSAVEAVRGLLVEGREALAMANRAGQDVNVVWLRFARPSPEDLAPIRDIAMKVDRPVLARRVIDIGDGSWTAYRRILDALEQLLARIRLIRPARLE